jgi:hypothetical protein
MLVADGAISASDGTLDVAEGGVDPLEGRVQGGLATGSSDDWLVDAASVADPRKAVQAVTDNGGNCAAPRSRIRLGGSPSCGATSSGLPSLSPFLKLHLVARDRYPQKQLTCSCFVPGTTITYDQLKSGLIPAGARRPWLRYSAAPRSPCRRASSRSRHRQQRGRANPPQSAAAARGGGSRPPEFRQSAVILKILPKQGVRVG